MKQGQAEGPAGAKFGRTYRASQRGWLHRLNGEILGDLNKKAPGRAAGTETTNGFSSGNIDEKAWVG